MADRIDAKSARLIIEKEINNYRNVFVKDKDRYQSFDINIENSTDTQMGIIWTSLKISKDNKKIINNKWTGSGFPNTLAFASLLSTVIRGVNINDGANWTLKEMQDALAMEIPNDLIMYALAPLSSFINACRLYRKGIRG